MEGDKEAERRRDKWVLFFRESVCVRVRLVTPDFLWWMTRRATVERDEETERQAERKMKEEDK